MAANYLRREASIRDWRIIQGKSKEQHLETCGFPNKSRAVTYRGHLFNGRKQKPRAAVRGARRAMRGNKETKRIIIDTLNRHNKPRQP